MQNNEKTDVIWNPFTVLFKINQEFNEFGRDLNVNYAVIVLNTPIKFHPNFLLSLWCNAKFRMTIDGGTDRWLSWLKLHNIDLDNVPCPECISGDLDSIQEDTLKYFKNSSTNIVKTPSQDETDFTKALRLLDEQCKSNNSKIDAIYVIVTSSGRLDQIMANINTLFYAQDIVPLARVYLLSSDSFSISWLLKQGSHKIHIPLALRNSQEWCAMIPLSSAATATTSGLKWNLKNTGMRFGQLVSSSNTYDGSPVVEIETDNTILWTMGIENLLICKKASFTNHL